MFAVIKGDADWAEDCWGPMVGLFGLAALVWSVSFVSVFVTNCKSVYTVLLPRKLMEQTTVILTSNDVINGGTLLDVLVLSSTVVVVVASGFVTFSVYLNVLSDKNPFGPDGKNSPPLTSDPPIIPPGTILSSDLVWPIYGIKPTFAILPNIKLRSEFVLLYLPAAARAFNSSCKFASTLV